MSERLVQWFNDNVKSVFNKPDRAKNSNAVEAFDEPPAIKSELDKFAVLPDNEKTFENLIVSDLKGANFLAGWSILPEQERKLENLIRINELANTCENFFCDGLSRDIFFALAFGDLDESLRTIENLIAIKQSLGLGKEFSSTALVYLPKDLRDQFAGNDLDSRIKKAVDASKNYPQNHSDKNQTQYDNEQTL